MSRHARHTARCCRHLFAAAAATAGFTAIAQAATFNVSWDGAAAGSYNTAVNWSTNTVPLNSDVLNDFYNVTINRAGGANVTGNLSQIEILNLTLGANAGNQLTLADHCTFNVTGTSSFGPATVTNGGTIQIGATAAAASQFRFLGSTNTLGGGGTIVLVGSNANFFSSGTLTSNNTIVGFGNVATNFALINNATITASGGSLTVDAGNTGGLDNNGLIQSIAGGTLALSGAGGGTFANGGGTIANNGGRVNLINGATIAGGGLSTLHPTRSSIFFVPGGQSGGLAGVTSTADVNVGTGGTLTLTGSVTNNGRIRTNSSAGVATFNLGASTVTLNGTGSLNLAALSTSAGQVIGTGTLVNGAAHSIFGAGTLGNGSLFINNNGLINASIAGQPLYLRPEGVGVGMVNTGILRASLGEMRLQNFGQIQFDNLGTIDVQSNGTLTLDIGSSNLIVSISGGTIDIAAGGVMRSLNATGALQVSAGVRINNAGSVLVDDSAWRVSNTHFANSGSVTITPDGGFEIFSSNLTFSGAGEVILSGGGAAIAGAGTLRNLGNLIHGSGAIGLNEVAMTNSGTISADVPAQTLVIDPGGGNLSNSGTLQATGGGILRLSGAGGGTFVNNGTLAVQGSGTVQLADGALVSGGTLVESSTLSRFEVPSGSTATLVGVTPPPARELFATLPGPLPSGGTTSNSGAPPPAGGGGRYFTTPATTLAGNGTLVLGTVGLPSTLSISGTLVNSSNVIRGFGEISSGSFVNGPTGEVRADAAGQTLRLLPGSLSQYENQGVFRATNGGLLQLESALFTGGFHNTGAGAMIAEDGSRLRLSNTGVTGGTISTSGTGTIDLVAATLADLSLSGRAIHSSGDLTVASLTTSTGSLTSAVDGVKFVLLNSGSSTFVNNGSILLNPPSGFGMPIVGGGTLVNNGTLAGDFDFDPDTAAAIHVINTGLMETAGAVPRIRFDPNGLVSAALTVNHTGMLRANSSGTIEIASNAVVTGSGTVDIRPNAQLTSGGTVTLGATVIDGGAIVANKANLGRVSGGGTLNLGFVPIITQPIADATVTHSRVAVLNIFDHSRLTTVAGGGTLGTSRVTSLNFVNSGTGSLTGRWDLTDHDLVLDYSVASPFASAIALVQTGYSGGAWTGNGLTSSSAQSAAATTDRTGLAIVEAGELFPSFPQEFSGQSIDSTTVLLVYTLVGDANLDRTVGIADFSALGANFNTSGRWNRGDFNYDLIVGIGDFSLLAANFNKTLPAATARSVPEPAAIVLVTVAGLLGVRRR